MPNPDRRKFVNPLTQSTMDKYTETPTLPSTDASTLPYTYTSTLSQAQRRKRGAQAFEKTHERITLWIDKGLKQRFERLADEQSAAKTTLLDEAITDLLKKYDGESVSPAPVVEPAPVARPRYALAGEPVPDNLISLPTFADQHGIARNEAERLWKIGMIAGVRVVGKGVMLYPLGLHDFWVQFHEKADFRSCDKCPHTQQ